MIKKEKDEKMYVFPTLDETNENWLKEVRKKRKLNMLKDNESKQMPHERVSLIPEMPVFKILDLSLKEKRDVSKGFYIAGYKHYDGEKIESRLSVGMRLKLKREPDNQFDKNAVAVWGSLFKLGYLPMAQNKPIVAKLNEGEEIFAEIVKVKTDSPTWQRVKIQY